MKRFALAALAVITLIGLTGCDLLGNKDAGTSATTQDDGFSGTGLSNSKSTWWLKGSFDGWDQQGGSGAGDTAATGAATHFFSVDSLSANLLGFTMTIPTSGLRKTDYKFVVMGPAAAGSEASRVKYTFVYPTGTSVLSDNTVYTLVPSTTTGAADIAFVASATSYTVKVDISNPTSPKIKLVPGTTASTSYSEQEMADQISLKGSAFDFGWDAKQDKTSALYSYDAATHKVTFSNLSAGGKSGAYVLTTMSGDFRGAALDLSTLTQGVSAPLNLLNSGSDATFTNFPNWDSKLKIEVTIDAAGATPADKYKFAVTLTSTGTSAWIDPASAPAITAMTNGAGGGSSWGATLGSIGTAISGSNLLVKVSFSTPGSGNNVFVLLDNPAVTTGALTANLAGDLTTGWGDFGLTANTANMNPDLALWGYRSGATYNSGGVKSLTSDGTTLTGTSLKSVQVVNGTNGDIWFQIPLSVLGLTSTNNTLKAVVLFGKTQGENGFHSAIPAALMAKDNADDKDCVPDIKEVATVTLTGL